ncbi:MAG: polysaccharide biosynthesis protein [Pseudoflavonifractor sp.]|nr:polysaccharide biosynthesis protein [Alloprevotella sp.]MCM1117038.1 polysaccharide biosynthesis protein [Pseudoflavonifractor sp.]
MINISHNRYLHTSIVLAIDVIASLCASALVLFVVSMLVPAAYFDNSQRVTWLIASVIASVLSFRFGQFHRVIIRYTTLREMSRFSVVVLGKEVILWFAMILTGALAASSNLLMGMICLDLFVTACAITFIRVAMITVYDILGAKAREDSKLRKVLVYGVSDKAVSAMARLRNSPNFKVVGFIDYGKKPKRILAGKTVFQFITEDDIKAIAANGYVDGILFPYVANARDEQNRLIKFCQAAKLKTYITPGIDELTEGAAIGNYIRKIKIEDLLGRSEIEINMKEILANFSGKVIMVTGAAGSIGSELCRQLATLGVSQLVLFDNAETPLHNIRLELQDRFPSLNFVPIIGDVRSKERLDEIFDRYRPKVVFHAAAYKHVPLMEENPCEAVRVNVIGSRQVADMCVKYDVEKMVMVSTDKAVNPTNIMGCTKRLAEIYVQSLGLAIESGLRKGKTKFVTTRFGNVLGSNGSVIPRFREQIESGGPITVTHPEIRRFFMTIPEACRLVMEAATFSSATQIFVFDMGEPVKIADLAEKMITLAGLEPGRDIEIKFTGLRPGEKLYEEVLATKESTIPTTHQRIFVAKVRKYDIADVEKVEDGLDTFSAHADVIDMVKLMKRTVPEFKSQHSEFAKYDVAQEEKKEEETQMA